MSLCTESYIHVVRRKQALIDDVSLGLLLPEDLLSTDRDRSERVDDGMISQFSLTLNVPIVQSASIGWPCTTQREKFRKGEENILPFWATIEPTVTLSHKSAASYYLMLQEGGS